MIFFNLSPLKRLQIVNMLKLFWCEFSGFVFLLGPREVVTVGGHVERKSNCDNCTLFNVSGNAVSSTTDEKCV